MNVFTTSETNELTQLLRFDDNDCALIEFEARVVGEFWLLVVHRQHRDPHSRWERVAFASSDARDDGKLIRQCLRSIMLIL